MLQVPQWTKQAAQRTMISPARNRVFMARACIIRAWIRIA